jgi:tRNA A37 methylthiotransferase MiaB
MKRFGGTKDFLNLIKSIRKISPQAGIRSNFIVGFPGETEEEYAEIKNFLEQAELDAIGIFGYSQEDGTEAADFKVALAQEVVDERTFKDYAMNLKPVVLDDANSFDEIIGDECSTGACPIR